MKIKKYWTIAILGILLIISLTFGYAFLKKSDINDNQTSSSDIKDNQSSSEEKPLDFNGGKITDFTETPSNSDINEIIISSDVLSSEEQSKIFDLFKIMHTWSGFPGTFFLDISHTGWDSFDETIAYVAFLELFGEEKNLINMSDGDYLTDNGKIWEDGRKFLPAQLLRDFLLQYFNIKINPNTVPQCLVYEYIPMLDGLVTEGLGGEWDYGIQFVNKAYIFKEDEYFVFNIDYAYYTSSDETETAINTVIEYKYNLNIYFEKITNNNNSRYVIKEIVNKLDTDLNR